MWLRCSNVFPFSPYQKFRKSCFWNSSWPSAQSLIKKVVVFPSIMFLIIWYQNAWMIEFENDLDLFAYKLYTFTFNEKLVSYLKKLYRKIFYNVAWWLRLQDIFLYRIYFFLSKQFVNVAEINECFSFDIMLTIMSNVHKKK